MGNQIRASIFFFLITIFCSGILLFGNGCVNKKHQDQLFEIQADAQELKTVVVKELVSQTKMEQGAYQGVLEPALVYDLSLETGGLLQQLLVHEGQLIEQGQVLAQLATDQLDLAVNRGKIRVEQGMLQLEQVVAGPRKEQLAQAQVRLEKATLVLGEREKVYQRSQVLYANGAIAQVELERASNQLLLAQQDVIEAKQNVELLTSTPTQKDVAAMELALAQAELDLTEIMMKVEKSTLVAPESGVVLQGLTRVGQVISPGHVIYRLGVTDPLHIKIEIPLTTVDSWRIGTEVMVAYGSQERPGQVVRQVQGKTAGTGMTEVVVAVDNPNGDWLAGEWVTVTGKGREIAGHFLPGAAVLYSSNPYVVTVTEEREISYKKVELGLPIGDYIQVFGLVDGMLVVTEGVVGLQEQQLVKTLIGE